MNERAVRLVHPSHRSRHSRKALAGTHCARTFVSDSQDDPRWILYAAPKRAVFGAEDELASTNNSRCS